MIANILLVIGTVTAFLALIDLMLSDHQRKVLADRFIDGWNWIDDARGMSQFDLLRRPKMQVASAVAGTLVALALLPFVLAAFGFVNYTLDTRLFAASLAAGTAAYLILRISFRATSKFAAVSRVVGLLIFTNIAIYFGFELYLGPRPSPGEAMDIGRAFEIIAILYLMIVNTVILAIAVMVPLVAVLLARMLLPAAELVTRRLAENAKGPIIGAGAVLAAVGAVFKVLA